MLLAAALLVADIPMAAAQANRPSKTFVVVGTSVVRQAGLNAAREAAIAESKRIAVEQLTAELLALDLMVPQFAAIDTTIYDQADAFVQYYKVLSESRQGDRLRVLVEARVSGQLVEAKLRSAGIVGAEARPVSHMSLSVLGTDTLSSFVLFRSRLSQMAGIEEIQISEILPNRTNLAVAYQGTPNAFAEALLQQPQEGFSMRVYQESEKAFRIELAPSPSDPPQD